MGKVKLSRANAKNTPSNSSGLHISVFRDKSKRGAFNIDVILVLSCLHPFHTLIEYNKTVLTSPTSVLFLSTKGTFLNKRDLLALYLSGPTVTRLVQYPLAVVLLDNRLYK